MAKSDGSLVVVRAARVLVFDPDEAHQLRLCAALRDSGYRVAAVDSVSSIQPMGQAFRPDAALVDVMMPNLQGLAQARSLRAKSDLPLALLAMSEDPSAGPVSFGSAGADDFLPKPVALPDLLARLKARLKHRFELDLLASGDSSFQRSSPFTDPVTHSYNRRFVLELLELELRRGARFGTPFSVAVASVSDFRRVATSLGETRCDQLLSEMAGWLRAGLRETDVLARVGADKFAMLLPGTGDETVQIFAARLGAILSRRRLVPGQGVELEARLGLASFPLAKPRSAEKFLERAMADLKRTKLVRPVG